MEAFFLDSGMSWTMSKVIPYLITILLGIVLVFILKRPLKSINKYVKWLLLLVIFALPFGVYFVMNPIYQGDFSNNSVEAERAVANKELTGEKLVVITIPGCKYCYEAIDDLIVMKSRVEGMQIEYVVCSKDSSAIQWYSDKAGESIHVRLADNPEAMMELANFSFPAFILVDNNKPHKKWSNDSFGVFAKDEVELNFN